MSGSVAPARAPRFHLLLAAATLVMFLFAQWRTPLPNEDGVLYLVLAERIATQGFAAAYALFDKPVYSALIAALHGALGIPVLAAARVLNALCVLLLVAAFTEFCRLLYDDARVRPYAALLLLAHPKINNFMSFVIRDLGYWALLFASFCLLARFLATRRRALLGAWVLCVLAATALRPEALAFALTMPLVITATSHPGRWRDAALALAAVLLPLLALRLLPGLPLPPAGELPRTPLEYLQAIPAGFAAAVERQAAAVLDPVGRDMAAVSLAGGLFAILLARLLNTLGPLQVLLLALGTRTQRLLPAPPQRTAWVLLLATGCALPLLFLAWRQFLDTRYVMVPTLLLLVPAARALQHLLAAVRQRHAGTRIARTAPLLVLALLGADLALGLDRSKPHLLECARWMREHLDPHGPRIFTNDKQLAVAGGADWDWDEAHFAARRLAERNVPLDGVQYWIIRLRPGQPELAADLAFYAPRLQTVIEFHGERGDRVVVYRVVPAT
jgi:hypothetical protein